MYLLAGGIPASARRILAAAILAAAGRGETRGQRSVFVQTIQKRDDDGKSTAAQHVRAENPVLATEHEKRNQNPESRITLRKAIHKETSCFTAGVCSLVKIVPAVLYFYYILFQNKGKGAVFFIIKGFDFVANPKKLRYNRRMLTSRRGEYGFSVRPNGVRTRV